MNSDLGNTINDVIQSVTMILIVVALATLTVSVSLLRRAIHVHSASRFTEHLTNQTVAALREDGIE
jgi:hypothetical protein